MKDFTTAYRGTFINLCTENLIVDSTIRAYFASKNFSVIPFLKETNSFVLIVSDYPVDKGKLFKILDPYRKFCDTALLLILQNQTGNQPLLFSEFIGYGITNIFTVSSITDMVTELDKAFSRWVAINNLVNIETEKKKSELESLIHLPSFKKLPVQHAYNNHPKGRCYIEFVDNQENVFTLFDYNR
jgi:hypothetical protein